MVPKECRFNQSKTACGLCAGIAWHFPCLPAMARDGELIKMQHSCHHNNDIDIIHHPNSSSKCTERLHMDATIIRSFQKELFSRFLPSTYAGHVGPAAVKPWWFMPKWKDGSTVKFKCFLFKIQPTLITILPTAQSSINCHSLSHPWPHCYMLACQCSSCSIVWSGCNCSLECLGRPCDCEALSLWG